MAIKGGPGPRRPATRKLTKKQEAIARARVKDPNASLSELGKAAGYNGITKQVVAVAAWKAINTPSVKERIRQLMERHKDTSLDGLHKTLADGLKASEIKFFAHEGRVKDKRVTVDHGTRHRYLETALEMHGALDKDKGGNVTNNFFTKDAMEAFVDAFKNKGAAAAQAPQIPAPPPPDPPAAPPEADGHSS